MPKASFATKELWIGHFDKHKKEFGDITSEKYLEKAYELATAKENEDETIYIFFKPGKEAESWDGEIKRNRMSVLRDDDGGRI